jgi:hypothetical protein
MAIPPGSLRDALLPVVQLRDSITEGLGLRPHTVTLRTRTWSGGVAQRGTPTITDLVLTPTPAVNAKIGDPEIRIGPITPAYSGVSSGGYTPDQLAPKDVAADDWFYLITLPDGRAYQYVLLRLTTSNAFSYFLDLQAFGVEGRLVPF